MHPTQNASRFADTFVMSHIRCDEDHLRGDRCGYRVAWSINPHMRIGASDPDRARAQHAALRTAMIRAGAKVIDVPFVHGAYDSVFAKDNAILLAPPRVGARPRALLARPRYLERASEQAHRATELYEMGFEITSRPGAPLEGGDVVVLPGCTGAFLGCGPRSSTASADELSRFLEAPVATLELRDPTLYHLDTALAVLSDGTALVCNEALTPDSLQKLHDTPGITRVLLVPVDEARSFGLNLVEVGTTVLLGSAAPTVSRWVRMLGRTVCHVPLDEFQFAGGSAACLVSRLHVHPTHSMYAGDLATVAMGVHTDLAARESIPA